MLKKRVEALESVSLVVPVTFNIHNCHSVLKSDDYTILYQQHFLTHPHGYRLEFYCSVWKGEVWFNLKNQGDIVSKGLPYPKHITLSITIRNQIRNDNHLQLGGEYELKNNELVRIKMPNVKLELLYPDMYGIRYIMNDTLCCTFDTKLLYM